MQRIFKLKRMLTISHILNIDNQVNHRYIEQNVYLNNDKLFVTLVYEDNITYNLDDEIC